MAELPPHSGSLKDWAMEGSLQDMIAQGEAAREAMPKVSKQELLEMKKGQVLTTHDVDALIEAAAAEEGVAGAGKVIEGGSGNSSGTLKSAEAGVVKSVEFQSGVKTVEFQSGVARAANGLNGPNATGTRGFSTVKPWHGFQSSHSSIIKPGNVINLNNVAAASSSSITSMSGEQIAAAAGISGGMSSVARLGALPSANISSGMISNGATAGVIGNGMVGSSLRGFASEAAAAAAKTPVEEGVKYENGANTRVISKENLKKRKNVLHQSKIISTLCKLYEKEGSAVFTRGLVCTWLCQGINIGLNFGIYETICANSLTFNDTTNNAFDCLIAGATSGCIASSIVHPLDLIRR
jgi:hypothetical protein